MRICHGLLCERTATVWMRGKAWCVPCSIKRFGIVAPHGAAPTEDPVLRRGGRLTTSTPPRLDAPPAPSYDDPLVALLEENGWDLLDIELELISHLEGELGW